MSTANATDAIRAVWRLERIDELERLAHQIEVMGPEGSGNTLVEIVVPPDSVFELPRSELAAVHREIEARYEQVRDSESPQVELGAPYEEPTPPPSGAREGRRDRGASAAAQDFETLLELNLLGPKTLAKGQTANGIVRGSLSVVLNAEIGREGGGSGLDASEATSAEGSRGRGIESHATAGGESGAGVEAAAAYFEQNWETLVGRITLRDHEALSFNTGNRESGHIGLELVFGHFGPFEPSIEFHLISLENGEVQIWRTEFHLHVNTPVYRFDLGRLGTWPVRGVIEGVGEFHLDAAAVAAHIATQVAAETAAGAAVVAEGAAAVEGAAVAEGALAAEGAASGFGAFFAEAIAPAAIFALVGYGIYQVATDRSDEETARWVGRNLHEYALGYAAAMRGEEGGNEQGRQAGRRHMQRLERQGRDTAAVMANARADSGLYDRVFTAALPTFQRATEEEFMTRFNRDIRGDRAFVAMLRSARGRG